MFRYDLRCYQIRLSGIQAQVKRLLFTLQSSQFLSLETFIRQLREAARRQSYCRPFWWSKVGANGHSLSSLISPVWPSEKVTGKFKSKWVNAFKNVKGGGGKAPVGPAGVKPPTAVGPPPVLETSHQFAEYSYKNITSCDVCSQIMKGNTRQGLKCKLCRMNVHLECQDKVGVFYIFSILFPFNCINFR